MTYLRVLLLTIKLIKMNKRNIIPITAIALCAMLCAVYFLGTIGSVFCGAICGFYLMLLRYD